MTQPEMVITVDSDLAEDEIERLYQSLLESADRTWIVFWKGVHVAARQGDGTWVRICHDHAPVSVAAPPEQATWTYDPVPVR